MILIPTEMACPTRSRPSAAPTRSTRPTTTRPVLVPNPGPICAAAVTAAPPRPREAGRRRGPALAQGLRGDRRGARGAPVLAGERARGDALEERVRAEALLRVDDRPGRHPRARRGAPRRARQRRHNGCDRGAGADRVAAPRAAANLLRLPPLIDRVSPVRWCSSCWISRAVGARHPLARPVRLETSVSMGTSA